MERDEQGRALTFDAGLCIGCEACVPVCPEKVLRLEQVTDLARLAEGECILDRSNEIRCQRCGAPVAPRAMLERIVGLLGSGEAATSSFITWYCFSCRESMLLGGGPSPVGDDGETRAMGVATPPPATLE